jgi:hypothetical protein
MKTALVLASLALAVTVMTVPALGAGSARPPLDAVDRHPGSAAAEAAKLAEAHAGAPARPPLDAVDRQTTGRAPWKEPYGTYTVQLAPKDPHVPAGVWRLTLRPGGYTHVPDSTGVASSGRLSISGNVLTLSQETLCPENVGRYRWSFSDGRLRLGLIGRDRCSGNDRTVMLTSKPWTKRP